MKIKNTQEKNKCTDLVRKWKEINLSCKLPKMQRKVPINGILDYFLKALINIAKMHLTFHSLISARSTCF